MFAKDFNKSHYPNSAIVNINKILVVQTAFIGDVILASGLIEKIKHYYPLAQVDFLLRKGNESLFEQHPFIHNILIWDKRQNKYGSLIKLISTVRETGYDVVVNLQRFAAMGLLTSFSGAKQKLGFSKNPFSSFFTKSFPHQTNKSQHEIERNHQLIEHLTDGIPAQPRLYPTKKDYDAIASFITNPYICLAPTSVWYTKQFPEEKWIEFIKLIPEKYQVYLLGAPADLSNCQRIINASKRNNIINLAGKLSLLASAALMQRAVMNYVNDSAPMHLASAMKAPTCAIYCSTVPSFGFGPLAENSSIVEIAYPLYCRPCGLHGYKACPEKHFKCAYDIEILQMVAILDRVNDLKK